MVAMICIMVTKYVCNLGQKGAKYARNDNNNGELNMDAISISKTTKYTCNLKSEKDHIFLQSLSIRTKYACNVENLPRAIENNILMIASILNEIASIYGPFRI